MTIYEEGYSYYVEQCTNYGLQPLSLRYFVRQLSPQQLQAYNEQARQGEEEQEA